MLSVVPLLTLVMVGTVAAGRYRTDQADLAGWYQRAAAAAAAGRYQEAADAYSAASGYRDADRQRAAVLAKLAPYKTAYLDGVAALDAERYDDAIADLVPVARDLPNYEDATALLADARRRRDAALAHQADTAEADHDWLGAERALASLAAEDPSDQQLASRLAALRRGHAPLLLARNHDLYLIGPDMNDERLLTDEAPVYWPVWSPDRTRIAFVSFDQNDPNSDVKLYVVNADGTGLTPLADRVLAFTWPVWSPDGGRIAYTSLAAYDTNRQTGVIGIRVVDVASHHETDLTGMKIPQAVFPTWSPTGDRIAFVSRQVVNRRGEGDTAGASTIYVLTLASGKLTEVGRDRVPDAYRAFWSPTGDRLLIYSWKQGTWYEPAHNGIYQLDLPTGDLTDVNTDAADVAMPFWSPDGTRFAYVEGDTVVRVRMRGRGESWINVPNSISPFLTWSPDGTALIAAAADPKQASFLIPLNDGPGPQVSLQLEYDGDQPFAAPPQWSPVNPAAVPGPATVGGTALDPGGGARSQEPGASGQ